MEFPIMGTKVKEVSESFDLSDHAERWKYFQAKAGPQIERLKQYLDSSTFVAYLLAKKLAGKGTYSKMFAEVMGPQRVAHLSVGDVVREVHQELDDPQKVEALKKYLEKNYRGFISVAEAIESIRGRSTQTLIPTEVILALVRQKIEGLKRRAIFIDGFPRDLDQVSYSLYFREIMNLRDDPDFFVLIQVPEKVIEARLKSRVVCPKCQTVRNLQLQPTKFIGFDPRKKEFFLRCDNPDCPGFGQEILVRKEGDDLGLAAIKDRLKTDEQLLQMAFSLHGIPRILLRNSVPLAQADKFDSYEMTPEYSYEFDQATGKIKSKEKPWVIEDEKGVSSYSLLPPPVVLSLIYQLHDLLILG